MTKAQNTPLRALKLVSISQHQATATGHKRFRTGELELIGFDECEAEVCVDARAALVQVEAVVDGARKAARELGVPSEEYPAPVANACYILREVLRPFKETP